MLLQKTLLNIEGLGRQLDPNLDLWSTAKPFLEKWMLDQMGPQRLWHELQAQAPRYAKLLPDLPRVLHQYLARPATSSANEAMLKELIAQQKTTNRLLQAILYGALGFVISLVVLQILLRIRFF